MHAPSLHLGRLVPHRRHAAARVERSPHERTVSEARAVGVVVVIATAAFFGLWTAAALGYADAGWWPMLLGAAIVVVGCVGAWLVARLDR
jgi:hypothetical protein